MFTVTVIRLKVIWRLNNLNSGESCTLQTSISTGVLQGDRVAYIHCINN